MKAYQPFLFSYLGKNKGKIWAVILLCLCTVNATACNFVSSPKAPSEPPPANLRKPLMSSIPIQDVRELSKPATKNDGFGGQPQIAFDNKSINGPKGLKTDMLFSEQVSDNNERFNRLENVVQDIYSNLNEMKPSIQRLISVEKDLQDLTSRLDILLSNDPVAPRNRNPVNIIPDNQHVDKNNVINIATPKKTTVKAVRKDLPNVDRSKAVIHALRIGDHTGKTRLVIETSQHLNYSASLDPNENLLTLSFDKGIVDFDVRNLAKKSKLIKDVNTVKEGSGSLIIIELTGSSDLIKQGRIKPNQDNAYHRIFIDLKR